MGFVAVLAGCPAILRDNYEIVDTYGEGDAESSDAASGVDVSASTDAPSESDATALVDSTTGSDVLDARMSDVTEAGCAANEIECGDAGCVDPSMASNCGSCGNLCGADADLCAAGDEGGFACTTTCPSATPLLCGTSCVDPTSNLSNCGGCDTPCPSSPEYAERTCVNGMCGYACDTNYTLCGSACIDEQTDSNNCGGCGPSYACAGGSTCLAGTCQATAIEAGSDATTSGSNTCPAGGCPTSVPNPSGYSRCPFGSCNGSTTNTCSGGGPCVCVNDNQCKSGACVEVAGENDQSCGGNCTGTGSRDGFDCELASPGIPVPAATSSGTGCTTTLTPVPILNSGGTACLCVADSDCSSGKCINVNSQCTGTCSGNGAYDSQDCQTATSIALAWSCSIGNCDTVTSPTGGCAAAGVPCWCTSDTQCPNGDLCAPWAGCASGACTGTGTGGGFNCVP